jgi:hypothetical protein
MFAPIISISQLRDLLLLGVPPQALVASLENMAPPTSSFRVSIGLNKLTHLTQPLLAVEWLDEGCLLQGKPQRTKISQKIKLLHYIYLSILFPLGFDCTEV